ncbi:PREDICTED: TMV resistance protein N-like [Fragaria vesca subsp. vesca]
MEPGDKRILPVFFDVLPSDVRHQRKSFAEAFAKNEVKFSMDLKKVERWRQALRKVANLSGWVKENYTYERVLIEDIVKRVWEKVRPTITLYSSEEKLVGMDFRLGQMGLLLALAQKDVRFIGIWGMGGENVSQVWDEYKGTLFIRKCMRNKKVLLVVDDADSYDHLEKLAGDKSWFSEGSRIIVTTRDIRHLTEHRIELSFELPRLKNSEALELFSHKAFGKDQQEERCLELSKCFRNLDEWNSTLESLKRIPNPTIFDSLKLSYDALNDSQQKIFLDIAFFYKGLKKGRVTELLEYCYGFNFLIVINALIEKSLLTVDHHNNVGMHGLVQEMTWEIVRKDSLDPEEPGLYSRLCHHNDIFHVFTRNTGTEAIKGISLCLPRLEEADSNWNIECFSNMLKLRFLEFDNLIISSGPKFIDNTRMELKTPDFTSIPNLKELIRADCEVLVEVHPSIAVQKKLKQLILHRCKNLKSFPGKIEMDSLEVLSLSYCSKVKIPEFGEGMKNLKRLNVAGTASEELPSSIEHLVGLKYLYIHKSKSLQRIPGTSIFKLKSLKILHMDGCPKLKKFVESTEETMCLKLSVRNKLSSLFKRKSPKPLCLASPSPRALPSLTLLSLTDCNLSQGVLPDDFGYCLPSLQYLDLGGNNFFTLPASIRCLSKLRLIDLTGCKRLSQLPDLPSNRELEVLADECDSLKKLSEPSQQGTSTNLEFVRLTTVNCFGLIDNEGLNNGIFSLLRRLAAQRCGARLLYEQDMKNLLNPPTNIMKRSREYCDSEEAEEGESPSEMASGSSGKESIFKRLKA